MDIVTGKSQFGDSFSEDEVSTSCQTGYSWRSLSEDAMMDCKKGSCKSKKKKVYYLSVPFYAVS